MVLELVSERGETYKVFDIGSGNKKFVCRCKPIHYTDEQTGEWQDIDVRLHDVSNPRHEWRDYLASENRFTVGFREDGKLEKSYGIRYRGKLEYQFESTPVQISLDGQNVTLGTTYQSIAKLSDYVFENKISETVSLQTTVHEVYVRPIVKVSQSISDFKLVEKIDLTGFKITNTYTELDGVKEYTPDANNTFYFEATAGEKMWIPQPIMWDDTGETSAGINHRLYEENGILYYEKTPTAEGINWLFSATGTKHIDATNYYADTNDGYTKVYDPVWSTARSQSTAEAKDQTSTNWYKGIAANASYDTYRSWFWFDTSGIDDGATIDSATLYIYGQGSGDTDVEAQESTQDDDFANWTHDACTLDSGEYGHTTSWSTAGYNSISFNATGKNNVNKTGNTKVCCREYTHDYLDSAPTANAHNGLYYADQSGTSYDPYLAVEVSAGGAPLFCIEKLALKPLTGL